MSTLATIFYPSHMEILAIRSYCIDVVNRFLSYEALLFAIIIFRERSRFSARSVRSPYFSIFSCSSVCGIDFHPTTGYYPSRYCLTLCFIVPAARYTHGRDGASTHITVLAVTAVFLHYIITAAGYSYNISYFIK